MDVSEQEHEYDAVDGSFLDVLSQETVDDNHNQNVLKINRVTASASFKTIKPITPVKFIY